MKNYIRLAALIAAVLAAVPTVELGAQGRPGAGEGLPPAPPSVIERDEPSRAQDDMREFRYSRPVLRIGQDYTVPADDAVRDATTIFGDLAVEGRVDDDVVVVLGSARVASTAVIGGSLVVVGGTATIEEGAAIRRDLIVVGGALTAPPGFSPEGEHVVIGTPAMGAALQAVVPWLTRGLLWGRLIVPDLRWMWMVVGIAFLVYLVLNAVFDKPVRACADTIVERPLSAFLLGLLVLVLTIPALVILAATVIGLAVVPFAVFAVLAGAIIGKAGVARALGRSFVGETSPEGRLQGFRSLLIGSVVLCLAYMVPLLGVLTWALTGVLGLGAAAVAFRVAIRREHPPRARAVPAQPVVQARPAVVPGAAAEAAAAGASMPPMDLPPLVDPEPMGFVDPSRTDDSPRASASLPPGGDLTLYPRATFLDRVAAFAVDLLLVGIAVQVLDLGRHDGWFPLLLLIYHIAFWAWKGTTLGGIVCALRVVRTQGTELRFVDALVRGLASVFSIGALGIGCFWMLQDAERQMWHDKIAGTLVVKVPRDMVLP